jgi:hypothetical protein
MGSTARKTAGACRHEFTVDANRFLPNCDDQIRSQRPALHRFVSAHLSFRDPWSTGPRDQRATETLEHGSNAATQQRSERAMYQLNRTPSTGVAAATIGAATARLPSHSRPRHRRVAGFDDHDAGAS